MAVKRESQARKVHAQDCEYVEQDVGAIGRDEDAYQVQGIADGVIAHVRDDVAPVAHGEAEGGQLEAATRCKRLEGAAQPHPHEGEGLQMLLHAIAFPDERLALG